MGVPKTKPVYDKQKIGHFGPIKSHFEDVVRNLNLSKWQSSWKVHPKVLWTKYKWDCDSISKLKLGQRISELLSIKAKEP